jgi:replicative DNA helicase
MGRVELVTRMACGLAGVNSKRLRTGQLTKEDQAALAETSTRISSAALHIQDRAGLTVYEIRRAARRLHRKGLALVVVDYLQRITPADAKLPRHQQIGQITDGLKQLARELDVPVLCLCQLNRESEKESRPRLSHLRESGSIEQDADMVLILHRKNGGSDEENHADRQAHLFVEKNRNGETGAIRLTWTPERTRYDGGWQAATRAMPNHESAFEEFS